MKRNLAALVLVGLGLALPLTVLGQETASTDAGDAKPADPGSSGHKKLRLLALCGAVFPTRPLWETSTCTRPGRWTLAFPERR